MQTKFTIDRRRFLSTAAAVTASSLYGSGLYGGGMSQLHAAQTGENEHFWYRLAPQQPYVD
ncbi:MAG TPA: hypothetical protein PLR25_30370, partial [Planctomycetaceae bacterium]|nr:hypothetical protein [Planctomycetaceae bacterium]